MSDEAPHVKVTLDDIYAIVIDTRDTLVSTTDELKELNKDNADHESRIRALEKRVWIAAAVGMVGGAGLPEIVGRVLGG